MSFTQSEYKDQISQYRASVPPTGDTSASKLLALLDDSEALLFQGKETVQPVKIYQVGRIYRLARTCIEIISLLWPILRTILPLLKKIF